MTEIYDNWTKRNNPNTFAMLKYFDRLSPWACYIIAINPNDHDEIACIINGHEVEQCEWRMSELLRCYNAYGESPKLDPEFYKTKVDTLIRNLNALRKN